MKNKTLSLSLLLSGLGLMLWSALDWFDLVSGFRVGKSFCAISANWDCDQVSLSSFGQWFGIPLGVYGSFYFLTLLWVWISTAATDRILKSIQSVALITSISLGAVLFFYLKMGCLICLMTYAIIFALFFTLKASKSPRWISKNTALILIVLSAAILFGASYYAKSKWATQFAEEEIDKWFQVVQPEPLPDLPFKFGNPDAKIVVYEFSDFECPFCQRAAATLSPYFKSRKDVMVVFSPYPLDAACNPAVKQSMHPKSCDLSKGVFCAQDQGLAWEFKDKAFSLAQKKALDAPEVIAESLGMNKEKFIACLNDPSTSAKLSQLVEAANNLKVQSTPTFFFNGRRVEGMMPIHLIERIFNKMTNDHP